MRYRGGGVGHTLTRPLNDILLQVGHLKDAAAEEDVPEEVVDDSDGDESEQDTGGRGNVVDSDAEDWENVDENDADDTYGGL